MKNRSVKIGHSDMHTIGPGGRLIVHFEENEGWLATFSFSTLDQALAGVRGWLTGTIQEVDDLHALPAF